MRVSAAPQPGLESAARFAKIRRRFNIDGLSAHFLFVVSKTELDQILAKTLPALGCEFVETELSGRGQLVRVYIDRPEGVTVEDCARVSNHLTRLFAVEGVEYDRLEVSSPGLDRPLRRASEFQRFAGERIRVRVRIPVAGRRNFAGTLRGADEREIRLEVDGVPVALELSNVEKARLIPNI